MRLRYSRFPYGSLLYSFVSKSVNELLKICVHDKKLNLAFRLIYFLEVCFVIQVSSFVGNPVYVIYYGVYLICIHETEQRF